MASTYVLPQVKVFQEFTQTPAAIATPLRAFVIGPNYFTQKHADKEGAIGNYDHTQDVSANWPNRPAGSVVDQTYTKVFVDDALLRYYSNTAGDLTDEIVGVVGKDNRIRAEAVNFKANGTSYPLASALNGRDVAVGDVARVWANVGGTTHELWTTVQSIVADESASSMATPTADAGNVSVNNIASVLGTSTADPSNTGTRTISDASVAGYNGLADGYANETYTLEVTTASVGEAGGLLKVTSASGTDDATDVAITETNQSIGTRGLTFDWTSASTEWLVGDKWTLVVTGIYDVPNLDTGDSVYDSTSDTTYVLTCTKGGLGDNNSQISVSTIDGSDVSGPHNVVDGQYISIGTKSVTVRFNVGASLTLAKGEKWYIVATGRKNTNYRTIVLADDLPVALRGTAWSQPGDWGPGSSSSAAGGADLNLKLYVKKDIQLPRENFPNAPNVNWSQTATQITLKANAQVYDSAFTDSNGNLVALFLEGDTDNLYSKLYAQYRALLQTYATDINTITDIADVPTLLGDVDTDNPLALGVWYALRNSNGVDVKYMAVPTDDLAGYSLALDKATGRRDIYSIVPTTRDGTIQNTIASHVDAMSKETKAQWRICFLNGLSSATDPLVDVDELYPIGGTTKYTAADVLATVTDDPDTSGTQYTLVTWDAAAFPAGGGFVDMGVRANDLFRTNYVGDGFGNTTSEDYVIDAVVSNQTLRLVSGPSSPNSIARKFSILRSFTKDEEATEYGKKAAAFADKRVYYVWPDLIEDSSGTQIEGFYLAAALAGLVSGVVPQQGLTNVAVEGFTDVTRTVDYFSETQLDTMAGSGVWIVDRDPDTLEIFSRHEVSTCTTDLNCRELMVVKNVDSVSYTFYNQLAPFIGRSNVTPRFMEQLRRQVMGTADFLLANGTTPSLGGQIIAATITDLRQHSVNLDQVVVVLDITIPYPVNVIELKLVV